MSVARGLDGRAEGAGGQRIAEHGLGFLPPRVARPSSPVSPLADEFRSGRCCAGSHGDGLRWPCRSCRARASRCSSAPGRRATPWTGACGASPSPSPTSRRCEPDILLVPLLAFDRAGWRLGYGGGFYDRTLRGLRARKPIVAVGLAYDEQQVDAVPHLDYDERLDWVLTPSGPDPVRRLAHASAVPRRCGRPLRPQGGDRRAARLRARYKLDFVAVNGENAAGGFGITEPSWRSCWPPAPTSSRSATTPSTRRRRWCSSSARTGCCGRSTTHRARRARAPVCTRPRNGADVLVINAMGLVFMPELDCPFRAVEREIEACGLEAGRRRHPHRLPRRGDQREAGHGLLSSTAGPAAWSARTPIPPPPMSASCRAAPPSSATSACAATTNRCWAWTRASRSTGS